MRFFNTAGPVNCDDHYCLAPLERIGLAEIMALVDRKKYFVLHAPRQTGKTSCLLALMDHLNGLGKYKCLYANFEKGQSARHDVFRGMRAVVGEIASRSRDYLQDSFPLEKMKEIIDLWGEDSVLNELLSQWARHSAKPMVLLINEIDSLMGDTLISVLRQIRSGYDKRPSHFPQSIVLCGVRDVRDYRIHSQKEQQIITGGSAFNIKSESLRLGDFSLDDVKRLYRHHTEETGQAFDPAIFELLWELTRGQPWLVNALGYEACFRLERGKDRNESITSDVILQARENLILRLETRLDQLADRLNEGRVRRVIQVFLQGADMENIPHDDIQYVMDLGLICPTPEGLSISNAIYREVIPRELTTVTQYNLEPLYQASWCILPDGTLDTNALLVAFQEFFREHSEHWVERFDYKEAGPQFLLRAFLQRIVNSSGRIDREYGLGRKRTDLLVVWKHDRGVQKIVMELKILHKSRKQTIENGLEQTADYMDKCGAHEGHLIIFGRRPRRKWSDKIFREQHKHGGKIITVWGM